jgi:hypothetical protein
LSWVHANNAANARAETIRAAWQRGPVPFSAFRAYIGRISVYLLKGIGAVMQEEAVRWSIKVSKDTDLTLRTFLGAQGAKKGDLSKFIEEAVRRRVLQCTIQDIRARNADADPDEIQRIVDEAVSEVRAERRVKQKADRA